MERYSLTLQHSPIQLATLPVSSANLHSSSYSIPPQSPSHRGLRFGLVSPIHAVARRLTRQPPGPRTRSVLPRIVLSTMSVALYLFALSCIPLPVALSETDRMTATLSRLVVLGTIILGLLAGFGAVSSSWAFIPSKKPMYNADLLVTQVVNSGH